MSRTISAAMAAVLAASFMTAMARGDAPAPTIANISPAGVPRGVATEVVVAGANLGANPRLVTGLPHELAASETPSDAAAWRIRLTVGPETPLGVYPVRVATDEGLSNPFLVAVGQVPNVAEVEPNNAAAQATVVAVPAVVEATCAGTDVDYYKFAGQKGQKVLIDAACARIASGIDPQVRLSTVGGKLVASADDSPGLGTDARMFVELPEDGEYLIEFSDSKYQAGGRANYRLTVGVLPVAEEIYPLGGRRGETVGFELRGGSIGGADRMAVGALTLAAGAGRIDWPARLTAHMLGLAGPTDPIYDVELPTTLDVSDWPELREADGPVRGVAPVVFNGRIDPPGDTDRFLLPVTAGQVLRVRVSANDLGSALDASIQIFNAADEKSIASGDDIVAPPTGLPGQPRKPAGATSPDSTVDVTVPGGVTELAIVIRDLTDAGGIGYGYRLFVEPVTPSFQLLLAGEPQVSVPKGGTVEVPFTIVRQGYNGPITLDLVNPPAGLSVRPGKVGEGHPVGVISLTAAADAAFGPTVLEVVGTGDGAIAVPAEKVVVYAQQNNLPSSFALQTGLAAMPGPASVLTIDTPAEAIEAVHGYPATATVTVNRAAGDPAKGELTIQPQPLPPGFVVAEVKIPADAAEGPVAVVIDPTAALGETTLGLTAKGKFQDRDQTFGVPVMTLRVVRPVEVAPAAPSLEIKPGATVEVKGTVTRRGGFKEPVTLQINGLPAGLKAEPVTVAPEANEFTLKVEAAADAAAAEAGAQVAVAPFKLAEKDYNTPPVPLAAKIVP